MYTLNPTMTDQRINPQLALAEQNAQAYIQEQTQKRDADLKSQAQLYGQTLDNMLQQYGGAVFQSDIPEQKAAALQSVTDYVNAFDNASGRRMTPEQKQNLFNQIINTPASGEQIARFGQAMGRYTGMGQQAQGGQAPQGQAQGAVGPSPTPVAPVVPQATPAPEPQSQPAPNVNIDPSQYGLIARREVRPGVMAQGYSIFDPVTGQAVGIAETAEDASKFFQNMFNTNPTYAEHVTGFLKSPAAGQRAGATKGLGLQAPLTFPTTKAQAGKLSDIEVKNILKAHNPQDVGKIDGMSVEELAKAYPNSWSKYVAPNQARGSGQKPMSPEALKAYEKRTGDIHFNTKIGIKEGVVNANAMEHGGQALVQELNRRFPAMAEGYNGMAQSVSQPGLTPAPADGQSISQPGLAVPQAQPALDVTKLDPKAKAQVKYQLAQEAAQIKKASASLADWYKESSKNMNTFINTATDEELVAAGLDKVAGARDARERRLLGQQELDLRRAQMSLEMLAKQNQGQLLSLEIFKSVNPESFKKKDGSFDDAAWGKFISTNPIYKDAFNALQSSLTQGKSGQGVVTYAMKNPTIWQEIFTLGKAEPTFEAQYPAQGQAPQGQAGPAQPTYTGAASSIATRYGIKP